MAEDQPPLAYPEPSPGNSPNFNDDGNDHNVASPADSLSKSAKSKSRKKDKEASAASKRRCVSTACIACRRRKSKVGTNFHEDLSVALGEAELRFRVRGGWNEGNSSSQSLSPIGDIISSASTGRGRLCDIYMSILTIST